MPCDRAQRYNNLLKVYKEHPSQLQIHVSECFLEISNRPLKLDMASTKLLFFLYNFLPLPLSQMIPSLALPVSVHIRSSIRCSSHKNIVNFSSGFSPSSSNPSLHHHSLVQATFISPWGPAFHGSPSCHSCQHCNLARVISFKHEPDRFTVQCNTPFLTLRSTNSPHRGATALWACSWSTSSHPSLCPSSLLLTMLQPHWPSCVSLTPPDMSSLQGLVYAFPSLECSSPQMMQISLQMSPSEKSFPWPPAQISDSSIPLMLT